MLSIYINYQFLVIVIKSCMLCLTCLTPICLPFLSNLTLLALIMKNEIRVPIFSCSVCEVLTSLKTKFRTVQLAYLLDLRSDLKNPKILLNSPYHLGSTKFTYIFPTISFGTLISLENPGGNECKIIQAKHKIHINKNSLIIFKAVRTLTIICVNTLFKTRVLFYSKSTR